MTQCPKCGSKKIAGPRYHAGDGAWERLVYTCARCGYAQSGPTLEQKARGEDFAKDFFDKGSR